MLPWPRCNGQLHIFIFSLSSEDLDDSFKTTHQRVFKCIRFTCSLCTKEKKHLQSPLFFSFYIFLFLLDKALPRPVVEHEERSCVSVSLSGGKMIHNRSLSPSPWIHIINTYYYHIITPGPEVLRRHSGQWDNGTATKIVNLATKRTPSDAWCSEGLVNSPPSGRGGWHFQSRSRRGFDARVWTLSPGLRATSASV